MLDVLIQRMSDDQQRAFEALNAMGEVYVPTGRDTVIRETFEAYVAATVMKRSFGRRGKGQAFYLTGISGAGKTDAMAHLFDTHPMFKPVPTDMGPMSPYVSVTLEGPATLANLGNTILAAAGYETKRKIAQGDVWPMIPAELADRHIYFVHIDETQHLLTHKTEQTALIKSLKGLMNDYDWPLRILLSGMPETNLMLTTDDQAERRNFSVQLPSIVIDEERFLVEELIQKLCKAAKVKCEDLIKTDMPERIAHAANYQYGRVAEVIIAGVYDAVLNKEGALSRDSLARAYILHSHARGYDEMNPFLVDNFGKLSAGYFIVDEEVYA